MKGLLFFLFLVVTTTTFATHERKEHRNLLVPLTKCFNLILSEYKDSIDHEPIPINSLDELSDNFRSKSNDSLCFILKIWTKANHSI